jgi:hypothetical protein
MLDAGVDVRHVAEMLGHQNLETTHAIHEGVDGETPESSLTVSSSGAQNVARLVGTFGRSFLSKAKGRQ